MEERMNAEKLKNALGFNETVKDVIGGSRFSFFQMDLKFSQED